MPKKRDWNAILAQAILALQDDPSIEHWQTLSDKLNIPPSTLREAFRREFEIGSVQELKQACITENGASSFSSDKIRVNVKNDGPNKQEVSSESDRIVTLEQLLAYCKVDQNVWDVDHYIVNKWEVGAKRKLIDLTWDAKGRAHGTVFSDGELNVQPLIQVKAWLKRKVPIPVFPIIQPVTCEVFFERPALPQTGGVHRTLLLSDAQIGFRRDLRSGVLTPFHDRKALDLALQVMAACQPDRVDILGDWLDFAMWTDHFVRDPEFKYTTQPSLCEAFWWLLQMRSLFPDIPIRLHQGNHELRVDTQTIKHLEEAHQLRPVDELHLPPALSVQRLLALHKLGIEWIPDYPDDEDWLNDRVYLRHGEKARTTGATAKAVVQDTDCVEFSGHIHRFEVVIRKVHTRYGDKVALCCCVPCLCLGEVPGATKHRDWSKGVVILDYEVSSGKGGQMGGYSFTHIPFENDQAFWNGQHFTGREDLSGLVAAYPDWPWEPRMGLEPAF